MGDIIKPKYLGGFEAWFTSSSACGCQRAQGQRALFVFFWSSKNKLYSNQHRGSRSVLQDSVDPFIVMYLRKHTNVSESCLWRIWLLKAFCQGRRLSRRWVGAWPSWDDFRRVCSQGCDDLFRSVSASCCCPRWDAQPRVRWIHQTLINGELFFARSNFLRIWQAVITRQPADRALYMERFGAEELPTDRVTCRTVAPRPWCFEKLLDE